MAATDTIVGITGAALLAVVMVGVFVYEYNNPPAAPATSDAALREHFHEDYPHLAVAGDLDGDGKANYNDTDLDNDGVLNEHDPDTAFTTSLSGSMPAPSPPASAPAQEFKLHVEAGNEGGAFTLYYNSTTPAPLVGLPTLNLELTGGDATASSPVRAQSQGSTAVTVTITAEALAPGDYTLRVTAAQPGPATPFSVKVFLNYGEGHPHEDATPAHS